MVPSSAPPGDAFPISTTPGAPAAARAAPQVEPTTAPQAAPLPTQPPPSNTPSLTAPPTSEKNAAAVPAELAAAGPAPVPAPTAPTVPSPPVLSLSIHALNCCRGELYLTDGERLNIEQYLATVSATGGGSWRLVALPESASAVGKKARKSSAVKRGAASATAAPPVAASQERQRRQSIASHQPVPVSHQVELPKTRSSRLRNAAQSFSSEGGEAVAEDAKGSPMGGLHPPEDAADWPRRMQRILLELCKQPVCLPFLPRVSPNEAHYAELARKVYPAVPLSLETVLERLENGEYTRSLDVFNDVYTVFMCAFRYYEPGNQYWMMAQEASLAFGALTMGEPLCSAFTPASAGHNDTASHEWGRAGEEAWDSGAKGTKAKGGGKMASKTKSTRNLQESGSAKVKARGGRMPPLQPLAPNAPVTVEERQAFQELLTQMSMDAHFQLYNTFKDRAKWISFDTGEVELDDGATLPFVFREMVQWCRGQATQAQGQAHAPPLQPYGIAAAAIPQMSQPAADGSNGLSRPAKKMKVSDDSDSSDSSDDMSDDDF